MDYDLSNVPETDWSLIVTTPDETVRYYFYFKNYHVKLRSGTLNIKYTTKEKL